MAEIAGRLGDGINAPGGAHLGRLVDIARAARERAGRDPADFVVTTSAGSPRDRERLGDLGVDRTIVLVGPPYRDGVARAGDALSH
jgi:hypothetical protein